MTRYDHPMMGDEQKDARAGRAGDDNSQEVEDDETARAAMLDKQYPTGGPFRRWLWRVAEGATRYGSDGRGITGS
jgi:hypothetical protein